MNSHIALRILAAAIAVLEIAFVVVIACTTASVIKRDVLATPSTRRDWLEAAAIVGTMLVILTGAILLLYAAR